MQSHEQRTLKADLSGFAQADDNRYVLDELEKELGAQLLQTIADVRQVDYLLVQLRRSLSGPLRIRAGEVVDVLAKASAAEGDIVLIVCSASGVFAHVLDSQTESS
jgi:hypothetical protein